MYIDSLTIAALVIFFFFFGMFIKYCLIGICGMPYELREDYKPGEKQEDRS